MTKIVTLIFLLGMLGACASTYEFVSEPEGASVFTKTASGKTLLGTTPLEFAKSGLPSDAPFTVVIEKQGFRTSELSIMPQDNTKTQIDVKLKNDTSSKGDETLSRMRATLNQIFTVQEHVQKREYADALRKLDLLEVQEPALPEVYMLKGSVFILLKEKRQARKMWEKALQLDPSLMIVKHRLEALESGGNNNVSTPQ